MTERERERIQYDLESLVKARGHERSIRNLHNNGIRRLTQQESEHNAAMLVFLNDDIHKLTRRMNPNKRLH